MDTLTSLLKGNLPKFKETVERMLLLKISEKIDERKTEIAQGIFSEENINEISDGGGES